MASLKDVQAEADWHKFPMPLIDASTGLADIVVTFTYVIDHRLDLNKLRDAFTLVVDAWPMLSARVAESASAQSGLEYQIPSKVTRLQLEANPDPRRRQYLGQDESHRSVSEYWQVTDHLRSSTEQPFRSVQTFAAPRPQDETRYTSYNAPQRFEEVLKERFAVFTTQATAFKDATLISMSMVHTLGDGFCVVGVFKAWSQALRGIRPDPLDDIGLDLFAEYSPGGKFATIKDGSKEQAPVPKGYHVYGTRDKLKFGYNVLQDVYRRFPESEQEQRYICLPHEVVAELQKVAETDLKSSASKTGSKPARVGKSDVLYAWLLKHAYLTVDRNRPSHPLTIVNLRRRRPKEIAQWPRHEFLNGALPVPLADMTAGQILDMSLGDLALLVRNGVDAGSDPVYVRELLTFYIQHGLWKNRATNKSAIFCPSDSYWTALTDWRALKLNSVDWSGALPDHTVDTSVKIIATQTHMETPTSKRQRWALIGDFESGVWLAGTMTRTQWEAAFPNPLYILPWKRRVPSKL